ncbi:hypothetical protein [Kitasatospora sp. NPDC092286]|uniref:hypothetical protein n=1 Tax=Kitasatospora sp. NPDC092286 TaxID=3364087 RepID=UPI00381371D6
MNSPGIVADGYVPLYANSAAFESGAPTLAAVRTLNCGCPRRAEGGCVESLDLPALQAEATLPDGRTGVFLGRERTGDPITGEVRYTTVAFRSLDENGKPFTWALRCAGPAVVQNPYERARKAL